MLGKQRKLAFLQCMHRVGKSNPSKEEARCCRPLARAAELQNRRVAKQEVMQQHCYCCSSAPISLQLLRMFFRQQDEIRRLKDELSQKDIRIRQLQLELKNLRNSPKNN